MVIIPDSGVNYMESLFDMEYLKSRNINLMNEDMLSEYILNNYKIYDPQLFS